MKIAFRYRLVAGLLSTVALAGACGDDSSSTTTSEGPTTTTTAAAPAAGETVKVKGVDYKFEGLPDEIAAGTKVEFSNGSAKELHEFVAMKIPDSETRPVAELVKLPESEMDAIFGSGPPATVLLAPPGGGATITAVGDGTLSAPGRYMIGCFVPTGADPAAFLAALENSEGPPDVAGGPPHVANGMFAELKVT